MGMDKIVKQLNDVNLKLAEGVKGNPAHIEEGKLIFYGTPDEIKEIVGLIGAWSYKLESKRTVDLGIRKTMLEAELATFF